MTRALKSKRAIVVGGSRGIGRAVVEALADAGAEVTFSYVRDEAAARGVVESLRARGRAVAAHRADSTRAAEVVALFDVAGAPDIVVNVAGTARFAPLAATTDEDLDAQLALNTRGSFFVLREAARRVADGGRIVQFSTGGTTSPTAGAGAIGGEGLVSPGRRLRSAASTEPPTRIGGERRGVDLHGVRAGGASTEPPTRIGGEVNVSQRFACDV